MPSVIQGNIKAAAVMALLFFVGISGSENSFCLAFAPNSRCTLQRCISTGLDVSTRRGYAWRNSVDNDDDNDDDEWNNRRRNRSSASRRDTYSDRRYSNKRKNRIRNNQKSPSQFSEKILTGRNDDVETKNHFFSQKSLNDPSVSAGFASTTDGSSNLFSPLCDAAGITRPSRIQSLAWPKLITGRHSIVADQTGSGKTLAYLIPLLQRALQTSSKKQYGAPKLLILAPTAELADQIEEVCSKISKKVRFKTMVLTATGKRNTSIRDQIRRIQRQPVDVMISTPGRISTILRTRNSGLDFSRLQTIVLDEVDILLIDETFGPQLRTVGAAAPLEKTQFVFVTATLPDSIVEKVEKEFPGVVQVRGPGLHRVAPTVKERLVDVSVPPQSNRDEQTCFDIKAKQLLKALRQNRCRRTLIFCNTVQSCRQVENFLNRKDRRGQILDVGAYHNAMTPEARNENLSTFARGRFQKKGNKEDDVDYVLICTDRAARGVDFDAAPVDHVVIFDFPKDPAEYVRRVGRTARAGRNGYSTVFAYGWQLPVARKVMGSKLDSVTIATNKLSEEEEEEEFQPRKRIKQKRAKENLIKGNIEGGRLWDS